MIVMTLSNMILWLCMCITYVECSSMCVLHMCNKLLAVIAVIIAEQLVRWIMISTSHALCMVVGLC